jgi:hypothetical protein
LEDPAPAPEQWRAHAAEAADPATPPERLGELARLYSRPEGASYDLGGGEASPRVLSAVARNPNTPPELMARLAQFFADDLVRNPALPLAPLEAPDFAASLPRAARLRLAAHPDTPAPVLASLAALECDPATSAARLHVTVAGEPEQGRAADDVRAALATLDAGNPEQLAELLDLGAAAGLVADAARAALATAGTVKRHLPWLHARRTAAGVEPGWRIYTELPEREGARRNAAEDPRTPPELLAALAKDKGDAVRFRVAANPSAPPEALRELGGAPSDFPVRWLVAQNPAAPVDLLERLATDRDGGVRVAARRSLEERHPTVLSGTTGEALTAAALQTALKQADGADVGTWVRFIARLHRKSWFLPVKCGAPSHWQDRLAAALNPAVGRDLLETLAGDAARPVRAVARERLARGGGPLDLSE